MSPRTMHQNPKRKKAKTKVKPQENKKESYHQNQEKQQREITFKNVSFSILVEQCRLLLTHQWKILRTCLIISLNG